MISLERSPEELEAEGYTAICELSSVPGLTARHLRIGEREVLVCRHRMQVRVTSARCPHRDLSMDGAQVVAGELICPHHQYGFALDDGRCTNRSRCSPLRVYPSEVSSGVVFARLDG